MSAVSLLLLGATSGRWPVSAFEERSLTVAMQQVGLFADSPEWGICNRCNAIQNCVGRRST